MSWITRRLTLLITLCPVLYSLDALAAWYEKSVQGKYSVEAISVQDSESNNLGIFAGIVQMTDRDGLFKSAYLIMSPQGYLMPINADGEVVVADPVYFQSKDCSGSEYVQVSSRKPVFTGLPGTVIQGVLEQSLLYISVDSAPLDTTMHSFIDTQISPTCITENQVGTFYILAKNNPAITGHGRSEVHGPIALHPGSDASSDTHRNRYSKENTSASSVKIDAHEYQQECSPGCPAEDVNNGTCDPACWVAACSYDGRDCEALSQSEIDEMLSTICSPGCFAEDIDDGFCDALCNVEICNFDGGDCVD